MSLGFRVDKLAEADLSEAARWYRRRATGLDIDFLNAVDRTFGRIRDFPGTHERLKRNIHRIIVAKFPFIIIYQFDESEIVIVAVYHSGRRSRVWRDRI
jgi:toxin ParE1/3/4